MNIREELNRLDWEYIDENLCLRTVYDACSWSSEEKKVIESLITENKINDLHNLLNKKLEEDFTIKGKNLTKNAYWNTGHLNLFNKDTEGPEVDSISQDVVVASEAPCWNYETDDGRIVYDVHLELLDEPYGDTIEDEYETFDNEDDALFFIFQVNDNNFSSFDQLYNSDIYTSLVDKKADDVIGESIQEARGNYGDTNPKYWYFTTHGVGPGTIPSDLHVLETREGQNKKGTQGDFICLDGVLTSDELKKYDLTELSPDKVLGEDYIVCYKVTMDGKYMNQFGSYPEAQEFADILRRKYKNNKIEVINCDIDDDIDDYEPEGVDEALNEDSNVWSYSEPSASELANAYDEMDRKANADVPEGYKVMLNDINTWDYPWIFYMKTPYGDFDVKYGHKPVPGTQNTVTEDNTKLDIVPSGKKYYEVISTIVNYPNEEYGKYYADIFKDLIHVFEHFKGKLPRTIDYNEITNINESLSTDNNIVNNPDENFRRSMLYRLVNDCKYAISSIEDESDVWYDYTHTVPKGNPKDIGRLLWAGDVESQIDLMVELYKTLNPDDIDITLNDIYNYENKLNKLLGNKMSKTFESLTDDELNKYVVVLRDKKDGSLIDSAGVFVNFNKAKKVAIEMGGDKEGWSVEDVDPQSSFANDKPSDMDEAFYIKKDGKYLAKGQANIKQDNWADKLKYTDNKENAWKSTIKSNATSLAKNIGGEVLTESDDKEEILSVDWPSAKDTYGDLFDVADPQTIANEFGKKVKDEKGKVYEPKTESLKESKYELTFHDSHPNTSRNETVIIDAESDDDAMQKAYKMPQAKRYDNVIVCEYTEPETDEGCYSIMFNTYNYWNGKQDNHKYDANWVWINGTIDEVERYFNIKLRGKYVYDHAIHGKPSAIYTRPSPQGQCVQIGSINKISKIGPVKDDKDAINLDDNLLKESLTESDDTITITATKYSKGNKEQKEVQAHIVDGAFGTKHYEPITKPFTDCVGPMYDGHKHNGIHVHDRYETQELYDLLSEGMHRQWELKGDEKHVISHWDGDTTYYTVCDTEDELNAEKARLAAIDAEWEREKQEYLDSLKEDLDKYENTISKINKALDSEGIKYTHGTNPDYENDAYFIWHFNSKDDLDKASEIIYDIEPNRDVLPNDLSIEVWGIVDESLNEASEYRSDAVYGDGVTDLEKVIKHEINELGNLDIPSTLLDNNWPMSKEQKVRLEEICESDSIKTDEDAADAIQICLDVIHKKYPVAKYCLWLCQSENDVVNNYDVSKESVYKVRIEIPDCISDLGTDGKLYLYTEEPHKFEEHESLEENKINEGAEGKRTPGMEYIVYEDEAPNKIVGKRSTYTEAKFLANKLQQKDNGFEGYYMCEQVPKGRFKVGDSFEGPFNDNWELIDTSKNESLDEDAYYEKNITLYHGTPYKAAAEDIVKNGLDASKATITNGGDADMSSLEGKNYLAKDVFDAARYAVLMGGNEPYGYILKFKVKESDLTADEDPLGRQIWQYLHKGIKPSFDTSIINKLPKELIDEIKNDDKGLFVRNSNAAKQLYKYISKEDQVKIARASRTVTTSNKIKPVKVYKIRRPKEGEIDTTNNKTFTDSINNYIKTNITKTVDESLNEDRFNYTSTFDGHNGEIIFDSERKSQLRKDIRKVAHLERGGDSSTAIKGLVNRRGDYELYQEGENFIIEFISDNGLSKKDRLQTGLLELGWNVESIDDNKLKVHLVKGNKRDYKVPDEFNKHIQVRFNKVESLSEDALDRSNRVCTFVGVDYNEYYFDIISENPDPNKYKYLVIKHTGDRGQYASAYVLEDKDNAIQLYKHYGGSSEVLGSSAELLVWNGSEFEEVYDIL